MANVKIIDSRQIVNPGGPRVGQVDTLVTFQDEAGDQRMVTIPKTDPSEEEVRAAIRKEMETRQKLIGRSITV